MAITPSGNTSIDALIEYSWTGTNGQPATITYSFGTSYPGSQTLTPAQQAATMLALAAWSTVANVTFTKITGAGANLDFGYGDLSALGPDASGYTYLTTAGDQIAEAHVVIDDNLDPSFALDTQAFLILMHEIGHALGLKHGFAGSPTLPGSLDQTDYTVMSYTPGPNTPEAGSQTPQLGDIAALQYLYGANTAGNVGNTTYHITYDPALDFETFTLWDAGGNDTIDASTFADGGTIDLRETSVSNLANQTFWIASGVTIENAIGTPYGNEIHGNSASNRIFGHLGYDTLFGHDGADTLVGGASFTDTADSDDIIYGNGGSDIIYGNSGNDSLIGGSLINEATESGNDTIYGGLGNDSIYGNGGNDVIVGGPGTDYLYGGAGNDIFVMTSGSGQDQVLPFQGAGQVGGDILRVISNINGTGYYTAADILAHTVTDGTHSYVDLGAGNGVLLMFTYGQLIADDISIV